MGEEGEPRKNVESGDSSRGSQSGRLPQSQSSGSERGRDASGLPHLDTGAGKDPNGNPEDPRPTSNNSTRIDKRAEMVTALLKNAEREFDLRARDQDLRSRDQEIAREDAVRNHELAKISIQEQSEFVKREQQSASAKDTKKVVLIIFCVLVFLSLCWLFLAYGKSDLIVEILKLLGAYVGGVGSGFFYLTRKKEKEEKDEED